MQYTAAYARNMIAAPSGAAHSGRGRTNRMSCTLIYKNGRRVSSRCYLNGAGMNARINSLGRNGIIMESSLRLPCRAAVTLMLTSLRVDRGTVWFSGPFAAEGRVVSARRVDETTWRLTVRFLSMNKVRA